MNILLHFVTNKFTIFTSTLIAIDLAIAGCIYYITPHHYHKLVTVNISAAQPAYALLFGIMAAIGIIAALVMYLKWMGHSESGQEM
jgi:hypothetical protein